MPIRFKRRIRIAPGLYVNLSKSGVSVSAGPRGAKVTVSKKHVRTTVGIPGTGLSYTETTRREGDATQGPVSRATALFVVIVIAVILIVLAQSAFAVQRVDPDGRAIVALCSRTWAVGSYGFNACIAGHNRARDKLWRYIRFYDLPQKILAGKVLDDCHERYFPDFEEVWFCVDVDEQSARRQGIDLKAPLKP